jgi:hypothetical protein
MVETALLPSKALSSENPKHPLRSKPLSRPFSAGVFCYAYMSCMHPIWLPDFDQIGMVVEETIEGGPPDPELFGGPPTGFRPIRDGR